MQQRREGVTSSMAELLAVAFLGGLITGLSPCIVPVLPVVVAGGSAGTSKARPYVIIGGLVVSFSLTELVGSTVLSAIGLPQNFLFWFGHRPPSAPRRRPDGLRSSASGSSDRS